MERQIDKSKHLIFEHDTYQANIEALRQDLKDKKKIVLFVGAGINLGGDSSIDISWNGLLNMMLKDALSILSAEKRYTIKEKERLENLLCSSQRIGLRTEEEQSLWETLHTTVEGDSRPWCGLPSSNPFWVKITSIRSAINCTGIATRTR